MVEKWRIKYVRAWILSHYEDSDYLVVNAEVGVYKDNDSIYIFKFEHDLLCDDALIYFAYKYGEKYNLYNVI